jgi:hypothetical protein
LLHFKVECGIDKEYSKLKDSRMTTTILTSMTVANLKVAEFQKNELMYRFMLDAALLYAASLDYRRKHGAYPENLQQLIPEYFPELPKSPIDHKDYIYKARGDFMEVYALGPEGKHIPSTTVMGAEPQTQKNEIKKHSP